MSLPIAIEPRIKQRLVNALGERFDSEVQLESLTVSLLPRPRLSGRGLVLRHKHRTDVPPLVTIASFSGEAGLVGLLSAPLRVSNIRLEGLEINVPPGGMSLNDDKPEDPHLRPARNRHVAADPPTTATVARPRSSSATCSRSVPCCGSFEGSPAKPRACSRSRNST